MAQPGEWVQCGPEILLGSELEWTRWHHPEFGVTPVTSRASNPPVLGQDVHLLSTTKQKALSHGRDQGLGGGTLSLRVHMVTNKPVPLFLCISSAVTTPQLAGFKSPPELFLP